MDVDAEARPVVAAAQHPDVVAAAIRARDWTVVPDRLRGWAINDEIMMATVDANAIGLANNAAVLGALAVPAAAGAGADPAAQSASSAGMVAVSGSFGDVSRQCYDPSGHQLAASVRWACTFHNQLEIQRVARGHAPCGKAPLFRHCVRLRTARPRLDDMRFVMDMIRGLAVYEKEPEAVHTNEETMLHDGFGPGRQFQVMIAEVPASVDYQLKAAYAQSEEGKKEGFPAPAPMAHGAQLAAAVPHPDPTAGIAAEGYVPLAFAFTHGAYSTWEGRVLYLEDLYVQPYARRMGLSSILLQAVARAGHVSKCARVQWSALDWNKQAIDAYVHPRVGATPLSEWTLYRLWRKDIERVSALQVHFNRYIMSCLCYHCPRPCLAGTLECLLPLPLQVLPACAARVRQTRRNVLHLYPTDATGTRPGSLHQHCSLLHVMGAPAWAFLLLAKPSGSEPWGLCRPRIHQRTPQGPGRRAAARMIAHCSLLSWQADPSALALALLVKLPSPLQPCYDEHHAWYAGWDRCRLAPLRGRKTHLWHWRSN